VEKLGVREKLIGAGLTLLHQKGFNATGIQELADRAGVPKGSFYNHFDSKDAFAVEILERYWRNGNTHMLADLAAGNALARLRRYFDTLVQIRREKEFSAGCLLGNFTAELSDQSQVVRDQLTVFFKLWSDAIETCIREGQQDGSITPDLNPTSLASYILNSWEGAVLRSKAERNDKPLRQFLDFTFEKLLRQS
jgi:TetR/AcrR family transcriptional repressor of nem operon